MTNRNTNIFALWMLLGVLLGAILGFLVPDVMLALGFLGKLFLNALLIIALPLLVVAVISGVAALSEIKKLGKAANVILIYYVVTTLSAALVGWIVLSVMNPGSSASLTGFLPPVDALSMQEWSMTNQISSFLPDNLVNAVSSGQFLGFVLLAFAIGAVLSQLGSRGRTIITLSRELLDATHKLSQIILLIAPVGLIFLTGKIIAENNLGTTGLWQGAGSFIFAVTVATLIFALVVLPLILKFWGKRPVIKFFWNMIPAISTSFGTGSQPASLPVTYDNLVNRNHVDSRVSSIVLPLGAASGMAGTALITVASFLFAAGISGASVSFLQVLGVVGISVLLSFSAVNIYLGGIFLLVICFRIAGFPPSAYAALALFTGLSWITDRLRTVVNVWNDSIGSVIVSQSINKPLINRPADKTGQQPHHRRYDQSGSRPQPWKTNRPRTSETGSPFSVNTIAENDLDITSAKPAIPEKPDVKPEQTQTKRPERADRSERPERSSERYERQPYQQQRKPRGTGDRRRDDQGRSRDGSPRKFGGRQRDDREQRPRTDQSPQRDFRNDSPRQNETSAPEEIAPLLKREQNEVSPVDIREINRVEVSQEPKETSERDVRSEQTNTSFEERRESAEIEKNSESEEQDNVVFGRARYRRTEKTTPEGDHKSSDEQPESLPEQPQSSEPVQFGRSRRKRPV